MPPYLEIIDSSLNAAKSLSIWTDALQLKMQTPFADLFKSAQLFSNTYADYFNNIQKSFESFYIPNITESLKIINQQSFSFIDLTKNLSSILNKLDNKITFEIIDFSIVNSYLVKSDNFIITSNEYFSKKEPIDDSKLIDNENKQKIITDLKNADELLYKESSYVLVNSTTLISTLKDDIKKDITDEFKNKYDRLFDWLNSMLKPSSFSKILKDFALSVQKKYGEVFWNIKGKKYKPKPEAIGKALLGTSLECSFKGKAFIGDEIKSGYGFIDVFAHFLGNEYIVELKMLGCSYSISYAKKGINQLFDYMKTYNIDEGYLVIFDGRQTKRGEKLQDIYELENKRIYTILIKII